MGTETVKRSAERKNTSMANKFRCDKDTILIDLRPLYLSLPLHYLPLCGLTLTSVFFHLATNHPSKMIRNTAVFLILTVFAVYAEVVHWTPCPEVDYVDNDTSVCTIHEVTVDPCREAEERKPCSLKKGRNASITFDYTTHFNSETLLSRAYWASEIVDLPFLGMPLDACSSNCTICPTTPGVRQTYTVLLPISKKFPSRTYDLKWKLWGAEEKLCCFMFQIKLVK
ncbi:MD-2-related lipid-recognition protein [Anoplolepis gracilipes]|uniref:MD-2-related lipid-recognition protein n=1 Tax=Anoplolepis gracilipes TaxID=354296 RepID=UPI003BA385EC